MHDSILSDEVACFLLFSLPPSKEVGVLVTTIKFSIKFSIKFNNFF